MNIIGRAFAALAVASLSFAPALASADTVTPFGDTTGSPWDLSSDPSGTYGGVDVLLSSPVAFSSVGTLSAVFSDISGGADGGSPRFELTATNGDFFTVYLGTPPDFNDNVPSIFTASFSGVNLDNSTTNAQYKYAYPLDTLAGLEALFGSDMIDKIDFIVDGGWAANGTQELTLDSFNFNGTIYSPVPEPGALLLLVSSLVAFGAFRFMRRWNPLQAC